MLTAEEHLAWAVFAACQDGIVVTARLSLNLVCMPKPYILPSVHILHHGTIGFSSSYLFTCEQVSVCFSSFVLALKLKLPYFQFTILSSSSVSQHTASWCLLSVYLETWLTPTHFTSHCLCELLESKKTLRGVGFWERYTTFPSECYCGKRTAVFCYHFRFFQDYVVIFQIDNLTRHR